MPPPVRAVEIPKRSGGSRVLGVPTVADRVAQTVVRLYLEPEVEPVFHPDSYGYRPGRSALEAVGRCRERCWRYDWVIDLDLRSFFDSLDHSLVLRSVARHTGERWIILYVERWLKAPLQREDGILESRGRGSPQGSAISPLLANIFLHYALDLWAAPLYPAIPFERYADDGIPHWQERAASARGHKAVGASRSGAQLGQDAHRVLQGRKPQRLTRAREVRLPRPHASSADGAEPRLTGIHQLRRLPVVADGGLIGILSQADIAKGVKEKKVGEVEHEISMPTVER
jgi:hypothetical protein